MAKYFRHENGITVSEFQMLIIFLNRSCDYQIALRIVRDELSAKKEKNRYWIVGHEQAWNYFHINLSESLKRRNIGSMDELLESAKENLRKR